MDLNLKCGDKVWCLLFGAGEVVEIDPGKYPVIVEFKGGSDDASTEEYTLSGKFREDGNRTLFFSDPKVEALGERPKPLSGVRFVNVYRDKSGVISFGSTKETVESAEAKAQRMVKDFRTCIGRVRLNYTEGVFEV